MQQVKTDSQNAVKMGPGTLYGSLDRMIAAGLVAKSDTRGPCRIHYKLTELGQATLRAETERLSALAVAALRQLGTTNVKAHIEQNERSRSLAMYGLLIELYPAEYLQQHTMTLMGCTPVFVLHAWGKACGARCEYPFRFVWTRNAW